MRSVRSGLGGYLHDCGEASVTNIRWRFLFGLSAFALFLTLGSAPGFGQVLDVGDVAHGLPQLAGQTVTVRGTLQISAGNYFRNPHFVLSDDQGNRVSVSPWLPLEVPPVRPGSSIQGKPLTMKDFLGHTVALTGTVQLDATDSSSLLRVRSGAKEPGSVRKSQMATGPIATSQPVYEGLSPAGRASGLARVQGSTKTAPVSSVQTESVQPLPVSGIARAPRQADANATGVNLRPYKPGTWSDKIVVSAVTGTSTDESAYYAGENLYVDWAVLNDGDTATAVRFYIQLYVDGVLRTAWYVDPPLSSSYYVYYADYSIGSFSAGSHTIRIVADSTNVISESNETDNEYTKTINVVNGGTVNLTPYTPAGWSDKIVVANVAGTTTDSSPLYSTDVLYIDWAALNNGTSTISSVFTTELYIDGVLQDFWLTNPPLGPGYFTYLNDYAAGPLTAGTHDIKIKIDSTNAVSESNEADNEYTRTITVLADTIPNLAPYKPSGWSDKIVASSVAGTHIDQNAFCTADQIYIDWAVINKGGGATAVRFYTELYVDGILKTSWYTDPPLNPGAYVSNSDYALGSLAAGVHEIKIKTDSTSVIGESKEGDNEYTKNIRVVDDCGIATRKSLVLMVDFSDNPGQVSADYFRQMMFGSYPSMAPLGSLSDYYLEASYQKLLVTGDVNTPDIAWIRLPQTYEYYANGAYGTDGVYPHNAQKMVEDAVAAAKNLGLDFGPYDDNLDGYVDSLFVVHAGPGAEFSANPDDIWSHAWVTHYEVDTGSVNGSGQPVKVWRYSTEPEYWQSPNDMTMGVFSHEFGHVLGLPDLYDTDYSSEGIGDWSLMAGGSWNGPFGFGDSPAHMDPWSKWFLGWLTPTKITSYQAGVSIRAAENFPDIFQLLNGSVGTSGEYFLVENRQQIKFDTYLPGGGLLIWHIDELSPDNDSEWYPGCSTCTGHYHVALIQADNAWGLESPYNNRGDFGDPFPGSSAKTSFTSITSPNSTLYSGRPSGASVTSISASSNTMTATFSAQCTSARRSSTVRVDFDANGSDDFAVYRWSRGIWYILHPGSYMATQWGIADDVPVPGDYDGDDTADVAVWRPSSGVWYILPSGAPNTYIATQWGAQDDIPVPGDYDKDGKTNIAVWRPSTGVWYVLSGGGYTATQWGISTDIPVPGDYDGDGKDDVGVWRPASGTWYILPSDTPNTYTASQWGLSTDIPVPGNYNDDDKTSIAVWRPSTGVWYVRSGNSYTATQWGLSTDIPVPGDYDGDGKDDISIWRPGSGIWYVLPSSVPNSYTATQWGVWNDTPLSRNLGPVTK
jgi:M6 family metalloprotease-like protein